MHVWPSHKNSGFFGLGFVGLEKKHNRWCLSLVTPPSWKKIGTEVLILWAPKEGTVILHCLQ